jgi:hypothetical protein
VQPVWLLDQERQLCPFVLLLGPLSYGRPHQGLNRLLVVLLLELMVGSRPHAA